MRGGLATRFAGLLNHVSTTHPGLPPRALPLSQQWPRSRSTTLKNGLRLHRIAVPGTRAVTILAAFDAGARTERPEENGMAHFLEHLVFKGGEKYPTYRDVNEAAERIGAVLNAYTSHDLVAFHITARAQSGLEAADLLTDFVGPAQDRRRRARPRARRRRPGDRPRQRPAGGDGRAPDRRGRVRRPPARPPGAGPGRAPPRHVHPRRHRRLPQPPLVARPRGAAFAVGNLEALRRQRRARRAVRALPAQPRARALRRRARRRAARARPRARLQPVAPADVLPARWSTSPTPSSGRR